MDKSAFNRRSQNGRTGIDIVAPEGVTFKHGIPVRGWVYKLGVRDGVHCYRFAADNTAPQWVVVFTENAVAKDNAEVVEKRDLQGGNAVTLVILGPTASVKEIGYKGRNTTTHYYFEGSPIKLSPAEALVAEGEYEEPAPVAPPASGALADAFRRAGFVPNNN